MNFGPAGEGTDIMVKLVGWYGARVFSQALRIPMGVEFPSKYALLLLTKNPSSIPSCAPDIPYVLLKNPPPPGWSGGGVAVEYFLVPIHGEGITEKKPSRWNNKIFTVILLPLVYRGVRYRTIVVSLSVILE
jgi:hypothetical protein